MIVCYYTSAHINVTYRVENVSVGAVCEIHS